MDFSSDRKPLNWRNLLWLWGSLAATALLIPIAIWQWGISALGIALFFGSAAVTALSITAGYHRLLSHRSYEANAVVRFFYLLVGAAAFQGSALEWSADHRIHHHDVDTGNDPYNIRQGFFYAHMGWMFRQVPAITFPHDLMADRLAVLQHRFYVPLAIAVGLLLPLLLGFLVGNPWGWFIYGGVARAVFSQHCTFLINSLSHTLGTRPFSIGNSARDNFLMAILAYGEGYHNFHHRFQTDFRNGFRWYHWDPTKWLIQSLAFLGLARNLKRVPTLVIESARLSTAQQKLAERGVPLERLYSFKQKAFNALERWRGIYAEYVEFKRSVSRRSIQRRIELRAELKIARIEFKAACRQWYAYARTVRTRPSHAI